MRLSLIFIFSLCFRMQKLGPGTARNITQLNNNNRKNGHVSLLFLSLLNKLGLYWDFFNSTLQHFCKESLVFRYVIRISRCTEDCKVLPISKIVSEVVHRLMASNHSF